ncbi:hypothetical protein K470DRAFT_254970 [Piedraia hortae CBS 480.64]|uniref:Uncharacterized protein n=1 Tax=Piedraia hortae CBS 480.64 TaxID=1314780 RepID=A0A6A7C6U2_9PEZI|nr:hypothetical protein K470DRAFT_254970 [Piedraia hortae CBS 480.64]
MALHCCRYPRLVQLPSQLSRFRFPFRAESTAARKARTPPRFPENLIVYTAPTSQTVFFGLLRSTTLVVLCLGLFHTVSLPTSTPEWVTPTSIILSTAPFLFSISSGPIVSRVILKLPATARRDTASFERLLANPKGDLEVGLKLLGYKPWIVTRTVRFGELRRLKGGKVALANLEYTPERIKGERTGWERVARALMGRFWVNMSVRNGLKGDMKAPWEVLWDKIPYAP